MPRSGSGMNMGLSVLGSNPNLIFKRKYRWTLSIDPNCGTPIPPAYVKMASRPNLTIEETEINFLHGKMWLPGKGTWETITVTLYDLVDGGNGITGLYSWLATVYNFTDSVGLHQSSIVGGPGAPGGYGATATLYLYDGCGVALEQWILGQAWPQAINFGELDYSSSEEVNIEITLRYNTVDYLPLCGGQVAPCCAGCPSESGVGAGL